MMQKSIKVVIGSVLATLLIGCGNRYDTPKVSLDTEVAVFYGNVHKSKLAPALEKVGFTSDAMMKALGNKSNVNGFEECFVNAGLDKAEVRWTLISLEEVKSIIAEKAPPRIAVAVACDHDLDKMVLACQDCLKKNGVRGLELKRTTVADTSAWELQGDGAARGACIASLDGKILLAASSPFVLEKQIVLYRDGKGEDKSFADFKLMPNELVKLRSPIHDMMGRGRFELMDRDMGFRKAFNKIEKNRLNLIRQIEMFNFTLAAVSDTACRLTASAKMCSEADAKNFRAAVQMGLMTIVDQLEKKAQKEEAIKELYEEFKKVEVEGKGKVVEVALTCPVSGFLKLAASGFLKLAAKAKSSSAASSMAMRGRTLFVGICVANTEREAAGLSHVWPRTVGGDISDDAEDIAGKTFSNATDYFIELFDLNQFGTDTWSSYVSGVGIRFLSAPGYALGFTGSKLKPANVGWSVAANVKDEMEDVIPVLLSCNFDPSQLLSSWDGVTDRKKLLKTTDGRPLVIVRKGGAAQVFRPEMCTYENIYNRQGFQAPGLKYLTPNEMVSPIGK